MKSKVKRWLEAGIVDLFLGYKRVMGHPLPHCFSKADLDEVDDLVDGPARYSLEKMASHIAATDPDVKIGMLARDCNQRALNVLYIWNQLDADRIKTLNVSCCPSNLKLPADCSYLEPHESAALKRRTGVDNTVDLEDWEQMDPSERLSRWMNEFEKCIKCFGCRNICPVCFCKECSLEHGDLVGKGDLPPEAPIFHLVRATHMAGRCIDCGLCEDACPVDIPLRLLYRQVNHIVHTVFDYQTGSAVDQPPFSILGDTVTLEPKPIQPISLPNAQSSAQG
ncbi:MAG: 4Fe-4S binding protein [Desulfosarcina sp.]|jgi:ferredoxin